MQKSNDNEIVQYLGVKHIINYLEVQVGLTQTLHFEGYLQYYVWRIWSGGAVTVFRSVSNCLCSYMHMKVFNCVCLVLYICVYMLTHVSGYRWGVKYMQMHIVPASLPRRGKCQ